MSNVNCGNEMVGQKRLKRLTIVFFILSTLLWVSHFLTQSSVTCPPAAVGLALQAPKKGVVPNTLNITRWFSRAINNNFPSSVHLAVCPPIKAVSRHSYNDKRFALSLSSLQEEFDYFGTVTAFGNFHVESFNEFNEENFKYFESDLATYHTIISHLLGDSGAAFTSFSGVVSNSDMTRNALRSIQNQLRIRLVSLANQPVSLHIHTTPLLRSTVKALEAANIQWLGLNAKKHHIAVVNGQRVGFLALCAGYGQCTDSPNVPFAPVKFSSKFITNAVNDLKKVGVEVIVALMNWGRDSGTYPDERALATARQTAQLGVNLIVGYSPNAIQDHAYFGSTLVIFSMGNFISFEASTLYCWKMADRWTFDDTLDHCKIVHPNARQNLQAREQHTRIYKIHLSRSQPVIAEYVTLPIVLDSNATSGTYGLRRPSAYYGSTSTAIHDDSGNSPWTVACGESDIHCLSCEPF